MKIYELQHYVQNTNRLEMIEKKQYMYIAFLFFFLNE